LSAAATRPVGRPRTTAPVTTAQAIAYARAINLRGVDIRFSGMSGMVTVSPERTIRAQDREARILAECDRGTNPDHLVAVIQSARFAGKTQGPEGKAGGQFNEIFSTVEVEPTEELADNNGVALRSRGLRCLEHILPRSLAEATKGLVHFGPATVTPEGVWGWTNTFGVELSTTIVREGRPPAVLYIDEWSFVSGPAEITLTEIGTPVRLPSEVGNYLLSLLHTRANSHSPYEPIGGTV
jgi:hypothetical protein